MLKSNFSMKKAKYFSLFKKFFLYNMKPVSYTHLDVYKRQMQTCMTAFKPAKRPTGLKKAELFVPHLLGSNRLPVDLGGGQIGQEDGGLAGSC